jgi:molybdenum cofactor cytidylyltransferase
MRKIGAIVLAAGGASRMGQVKQLLIYEGKPLVWRATQAALTGGCEPVVVVTGAEAEAVAAAVKDLPVHPQLNRVWETGMGSSIRTGLEALLELDLNLAGAVVLPCDQARLEARIIAGLMERFTAAGKPIAACAYGGALGTPCCFDRSIFEELRSLDPAGGAKVLLQRHPEAVATFDWPEGVDDVDTPADWERLCQRSVRRRES